MTLEIEGKVILQMHPQNHWPRKQKITNISGEKKTVR